MKQVLLLVFLSITLRSEVLLQTTFKSGLANWNTPSYWNGELLPAEGEMHMICKERNGKNFARVLNSCKQLEWGGQWLKVTVKARGQGAFLPGLIKYFPDTEGKIDYTAIQYVFTEPAFVLSDTLQSFEYLFKLGEEVPVRIAPILQVDGPGEAMITSYRLETTTAPAATMENLNTHQILPEGASIGELRFRFSKAGQAALIFHNRQVHKATTAADGLLSISNLAAQTGLNQITASADGAAATSYIDVIPQPEWDRFAQTAAKVKFASKVHCLFLGDSLTDFDRGHNSIDKLSFWLEKYNPGQFSIRNAAVRGDYITRVEQRLNAKKAFMQERYDNLFAEKYDLIVIWLGHNDTRADSMTGYQKALIPPEEQDASFRRVIQLIRQSSQAPILLLSPSPSNAAMLQERADKLAPDKRMILFGKAEHVQAFDKTLQKLAADLQLGYLNVTNPFQQQSERATLFREDGVHLSEIGHRFVALQLLKAFSENPCLKSLCK